jgi:hypothetical protein
VASNIPERYTHLETESQAALDRRIQDLRKTGIERELSDDELDEAIAILTIARKRQTGPAKHSGARAKEAAANQSLEDLAKDLGL